MDTEGCLFYTILYKGLEHPWILLSAQEPWSCERKIKMAPVLLREPSKWSWEAIEEV